MAEHRGGASEGRPPPGGGTAPLLNDQPSTLDLLNFAQYAEALRAVMLDPQTRTPLVIGIFGRWGSGKTTLMRMVEQGLIERRVPIAWFSAWLYAQEKEIWAAFLQSLTLRLTAGLGPAGKARFSFRVFRRGFAPERLLYDLPRWLMRLGLVALPVVAGTLLAGQVSEVLGRLLGAVGVAGTVLLGLWQILRPGMERAAREAPDFSLYRSMDFVEHIGFLERFRDQFARIVAAIPSESGRIVVFIDDLDRCPPDKALQVLDAIKAFVDVPGCIFVLGLDLAVIQKAVEAKYANDGVAQREYLAKTVQLGFHLPPLTEADFARYLRALRVGFPDERCRDVFLSAIARNPREMKRVINSFSLHWHLAASADAGLAPVRLAKVVVIQQGFPSLHALLRDQPDWLGLLERAVLADAGQAVAERERAAETTLIGERPDIAVPPAILPFVRDPSVGKLLGLHAGAAGAEDGSTFAALSAAEIGRYFSIAPPAAMADGAAAPAPPGEPGAAPDFGSRYRVLRFLARGGAGDVYLAIDQQTGREVAIKRLSESLTGDPEWMARFEREVRVMTGLGRHPNILGLLDAKTGTGSREGGGRVFPFYVMEYAPGETLRALLDRQGRLSAAEAGRLILPLFGALGHMHAAGIVHRDLKPGNILIAPDGTPRLADFGLAIEEPEDSLTRVGTFVGTPAYMSPEQIRGEPLDGRSDLFSLGAVIFEAMTGERAFPGGFTAVVQRIVAGVVPRSGEIAPDLPPGLDGFLARAMAASPGTRFPDAGAASAAFAAVLAEGASRPSL